MFMGDICQPLLESQASDMGARVIEAQPLVCITAFRLVGAAAAKILSIAAVVNRGAEVRGCERRPRRRVSPWVVAAAPLPVAAYLSLG